MATVCACNATLSSLLGGNRGGSGISSGGGIGRGSRGTYNAVATPSYGGGQGYTNNRGGSHAQGHSHGGAPQVITVILDNGLDGAHAGSDGYGYGDGYASGHGYGSFDSGHDHGGEAQIFKVITQSSGDSHGHSYGSSYASGYSHGGSYSVNSQLNDILPQILQVILEDDDAYGAGGGGDLNSQLIAHFGQQGKAVITRSNGRANSLYSGGHVVQKGELKVMRVQESPAAARRAPANVQSSYGPPINRPPSHGQSW